MSILLSIAIICLAAGFFNILKHQIEMSEEIDDLASYKADDTRVTEISHRMDLGDEETKKIVARLNELAEDIGRLDAMNTKDHHDLVDIRQRYILFREPSDNGAGVSWAKDYACTEEKEEVKDEEQTDRPE